MNDHEHHKKEHLAKATTHHAVKNLGKLINGPNDPKPAEVIITFILCLCVLATFIGNTTVKIVFRQTPVMRTLDLIFSILTFIGLTICGCYLFDMENLKIKISDPDSFTVTSVLVFFLAIAILVKGIRFYRKKAKSESKSILTSLEKEGWSQKKIKNWGEPLLLCIIGCFYGYYNLLGGCFCIFCAISAWIHILLDNFFAKTLLPTKMQSFKDQSSSDEQIHIVK